MEIKTKNKIKDITTSLLFVLPAAVLFVSFTLLPVFRTAYISFFDWNGISPTMDFVGIDNYITIFKDKDFFTALTNNFYWAIMHIVFAAFTGFVIAFIITRVRAKRLMNFYRVVFYLPHVVAVSIAAIMWTMIYHPSYGIVNGLLEAVGLGNLAKPWLGNSKTSLIAMGITSAWQAFGYYMVLFIAALQNIDPKLYEAMEIDGGGPLKQFFYVTIPCLRNVLTFVISLSIINGLKGFVTVWAMTKGGPGASTYLMALYVYKKAFTEYKFGIGAAAGIILGVIVLVLAVVFNTTRDRANQDI